MFPTPTTNPIQKRYEDFCKTSESSINFLIAGYNISHNQVWRDNPQDFFDYMGTNAHLVFDNAEKAVQAIQLLQPDFVPPAAPYEYTINEDGTVTVGEKIDENFGEI